MSLREHVIAKIEELYPLVIQFATQQKSETYPISIFEGKPGAALFFYQYAHFKKEKQQKCYALINTLIDDAFEYIASTPDIRTSYCDGIIGILWMIQFFRNEGVIHMDADEIEQEIIQELSSFSISQTVNQVNCDFLHGGFGFWAFLLEFKDLSGKERLIRSQLDALTRITLKTEHGINWRTDLDIFQKNETNKIVIDSLNSTHLGMAHGISIIVVLLAKTKMQGFFEKEIDKMIRGAMSHIYSLKFSVPLTSCYPMVVVNGKAEQGGRLAWCNGDLSVANAYWFAWKATKESSYKKEALRILHFVKSMDRKYSGVMDAGLCHGAAGVAQQFRQFFWETGDEEFLKTSDKWIQIALEMANYKDGYAGYKTYSSNAYGGPRLEHGFLSGICGIGTALLSSLSKNPTTWDRALQIC